MSDAPEPASQLLALQAAVAGRYSIEREIGRGGMGIVYLARDVALDRPVAIKLLPTADARRPEVRERFLREARTAARLSHPNIVPIFAVEEAGEFVFFVMAYVHGETLRQRVALHGPLPLPVALRVLRDVAWALAYAHTQGLVHRDVKPENILLELESDRALVTDFGIAQSKATQPAGDLDPVIGTPEFMSPEQASGEPVDHRSDLYAFGALAFFAFSGSVPFDGPDAAAVLAQHIATPAPALSSRAPGTPRRIAALVDQCLSKAPADRVPDAQQLVEALSGGLERRREPPPAIRVFLADRKAAAVGSLAAALMAPWLVGITMSLLFSDQPVLMSVGTALAVTIVVGPLVQPVLSARRLLRAGHSWSDAVSGLEYELERRNEELAHQYGRDHERVAQQLRRWGQIGVFGAALTLGAITLWPASAEMLGGAAVVPALLGIVSWYRGDRRTDTRGKQRLKRWRGAIGRTLFRLARLGLDVQTEAPALTHRPTEVAVGTVVLGLFETLPKAARATLGDVPQVVQNLEADAQRMRQRVTELDGLLADALPGARGTPESDRVMEDLRVARQEAVRRLAASVAALEKLRIDLLRLRAGSLTLEGVTANLGAARELTEQVQRLLAGYDEVERAIKA